MTAPLHAHLTEFGTTADGRLFRYLTDGDLAEYGVAAEPGIDERGVGVEIGPAELGVVVEMVPPNTA